jgi:hypothetical protein
VASSLILERLHPDYQRRNFSGPASDSSKSSSIKNSHGQNFSNLAKDAPVSYKTLRERGILDEDSSPTRKWVASKLEPDVLGMNSSGLAKQL